MMPPPLPPPLPVAPRPDAGVACPRCSRPLPLDPRAVRRVTCPSCTGTFEAMRFEAPSKAELVLGVEEAGPNAATPCPAHAGNVAVAHCDRCGVFMCRLCSITIDERSLCPPCFERLAADGSLATAVNTYRDYGSMATTAAVASVLLVFAGVVLGPFAVYYGVRALRQKREWGDVGGRVGIWTSIVVGGLAGAGNLGLLVMLMLPWMR